MDISSLHLEIALVTDKSDLQELVRLVIRKLLCDSLSSLLVLWTVGGLLFGFAMKLFIGKKGQKGGSAITAIKNSTFRRLCKT